MGNPALVSTKDQKMFSKCMTNLAGLFLFGTITGIFANIQVKRLSLKFLTLPKYVRYPLRLGIFALPFALIFPKVQSDVGKINEATFRIYQGIIKLRKTGNI